LSGGGQNWADFGLLCKSETCKFASHKSKDLLGMWGEFNKSKRLANFYPTSQNGLREWRTGMRIKSKKLFVALPQNA